MAAKRLVWALLLAGCSSGVAPQSGVRGAPAEVPPKRVHVPAAVCPKPHETAPEPFVLYERFPALRERFPRVAIGAWPTPVDALTALASELGVERVDIKRDDKSAEPYGGSKPRKLELLLGAAIAAGKKRVVTMGGVGSHHAVATAIYAARAGLAVELLLMPEPPTEDTRRALLTCMRWGADLELVGTGAQAERRARELFEAAPGEVEILPAGGSSPLGNVGFVNAGLELAKQIADGEVVEPDVIFLPMGTMGSAVGLAIGLEVAGLGTQVVAVRAASSPRSQPEELEKMFAETVAFLRAADATFPVVTLHPERLRIENRYLGAGYALPTQAGTRATALAAQHGITLDATYTAKAFAALLDDARRGKHRRLLFWHTHAAQVLDVSGVDAAALPADLQSYARTAER